MSYYCKLCDETIKNSSKHKHNISENHIKIENRIIPRNTISNTDFDRVHEIVRKYANSLSKEYNIFSVQCLYYL